MQLRFDGTLGFPGGIVEEWEVPSVGCMRECCEELGVTSSGEMRLIIIIVHTLDSLSIVLNGFSIGLML